MNDKRKYVSYDTRFLSLGLDVANMILLTEIENLSKLAQGCFITDQQLGELIRVGRKNTNERIKHLESLGYIECQTTYIDNRRRRTIKFLLKGGVLPQGNPTKRMRKIKVKEPQGRTGKSPQGDSGQSPHGNNNMLNEGIKEKKSIENLNTGAKNTGPVENLVDISHIPNHHGVTNVIPPTSDPPFQEPVEDTSTRKSVNFGSTEEMRKRIELFKSSTQEDRLKLVFSDRNK